MANLILMYTFRILINDSLWTGGISPPVKLGRKRVRLGRVINDSLNIIFKSTSSFLRVSE